MPTVTICSFNVEWMNDREDRPSDHRPVSVELEY
jgi:hypothetical protein